MLFTIAVLLMAACGPTEFVDSTDNSQGNDAASTPSGSPPSPPADPASLSFTATTSGGGSFVIGATIGNSTRVDDSTSGAVSACVGKLATLGGTPQNSIAIPVSVSVRSGAATASDVTVSLNDFFLIQPGGALSEYGLAELEGPALWAASYSEGPSCTFTTEVASAGRVKFGQVTNTKERSWSGSLILPKVTTELDPSGLNVAKRAVFRVGASVAGGTRFTTEVQSNESTSWVTCVYGGLESNFLAVDARAAAAEGCDVPDGSRTQRENSAATDRECLALTPAGARTVQTSPEGDVVTLFDRDASLYTVCQGLGSSAGVEYSTATRCAIFAAAATVAPSPLRRSAEDLCRANDVVAALNAGDWVGLGAGEVCSLVGEVLAVSAAGAAVESGPLTVPVYLGVKSTANVACSWVLNGDARQYGENVEAGRERDVARSVIDQGMCIDQRQAGQQVSFSAVDCP